MSSLNDAFSIPARSQNALAWPRRRALLAPCGVTLFILAAAVLLRVAAASGELWLDEASTLRYVENVSSLPDVFVKIHADNNHFLTSAYIYLVGTGASTIALRFSSILFGAMTVLAAKRAAGRYGQPAGVIAALLAAFSYFFVHYGSEARGYAGMMLAVFLAYDVLQTWLERGDRRSLFLFAAAVCFGTFSHLTMVEPTAILWLSATARLLAEGADLRVQLRRAALLAGAGVLGTAPAMACAIYDFHAPDYHMGWVVPFSFEMLGQGLAGLDRTTLGFPEALSDAPTIALTAAFALIMLLLAPAPARWFPALTLFGLPPLHAAFGFLSQQYPRFHLVQAVALVLLAGMGLGALWERKGAARMAAVVALALFGLGQALNLVEFFRFGRGAYTAALMRMSEHGPAAYAIDPDSAPFEVPRTASLIARRAGVSAEFVTEKDFCAKQPQWLLLATYVAVPRTFPEQTTVGPAECAARFQRDSDYPAWGLSGTHWALYRRAS
ncbi:MAG TPA: glycosyltransferase family 39 protein [Methylocystis sp.]|nr:glycosyltransferase family 39 protein [Methylocystis sp.]